MQRSVKIKWGKLQVGVLLMLAMAALMWTSITGGGTSIFDPKGKFVCYFNNVNGLVVGSPVWMSGIEVGNIKSLDMEALDPVRTVKVVCRIKKSVWKFMTADARVKLGTIGFLGDKYIEIVPGTSGDSPIEDMGLVPTLDIGSAPDMFKAGEEAFSEAGSVVSGLDSLLSRMNSGEGTLGKIATDDELYTRMTTLLASLTRLSGDLQQNQERLINSLDKMSTSIATLSDDVTENRGTIGKLMNDPALYDNLSSSSANLDSILAKIDDSKGNMGLLVNDTALYVEMTNLLARVNNLISDIESNPRKYFKFSVF